MDDTELSSAACDRSITTEAIANASRSCQYQETNPDAGT